MRRDADWRGSPRATTRSEFMRLLEILKPSGSDVFYDLGCGYARPCIWIAPKVKLAVGIEDHYYRYLRAKKEVKKSGFSNVQILNEDIGDATYHGATIVYSVISIGFEIISKIQTEAERGTRIVVYGLPPFPIRSETLFGRYSMMRTPLRRVSDVDEFARIHLKKKKAAIKDLFEILEDDEKRDLKREIRNAERNWAMLKDPQRVHA